MARVCATCGTPADDDAVFCTECGGRELRDVGMGGGFADGEAGPRCECGAPLEPDAAFCTECGRKVASAGGGEPVIPDGPFVEPTPKELDGPSRVRESRPADDSAMKEFFHKPESSI